MIGDPGDDRDIKIARRESTITRISDLHRSYDALQYTLIFCQGHNEYPINIKQCDSVTDMFDIQLIPYFIDFSFLFLIFLTT